MSIDNVQRYTTIYTYHVEHRERRPAKAYDQDRPPDSIQSNAHSDTHMYHFSPTKWPKANLSERGINIVQIRIPSQLRSNGDVFQEEDLALL